MTYTQVKVDVLARLLSDIQRRLEDSLKETKEFPHLYDEFLPFIPTRSAREEARLEKIYLEDRQGKQDIIDEIDQLLEFIECTSYPLVALSFTDFKAINNLCVGALHKTIAQWCKYHKLTL